MEAPRGVEVSTAKGPLKVSSRKDLQLESTEGEVRKIRSYALTYFHPIYLQHLLRYNLLVTFKGADRLILLLLHWARLAVCLWFQSLDVSSVCW